MSRRWYMGDTHLHTTNSDGVLPTTDLIKYCKKMGLDFMIVTDHNYNSINKSYKDGNILVIQGQELTDKLGHINIWGKKVPSEPPHQLKSDEDYKLLVEKCRAEGATISVNHPFCSNCPFLLELEDFNFDCIEIWNTVQHTDNVKNLDWWVNQLNKGNRIGAIGGSDFHRDYIGIPFLAMPTTYVLAESNTTEDILKAMREGRSIVTNSPRSSKIFLSCGEGQVGDTVKLSEHNKARIAVTKLKKGHRVIIYNNNEIIFDYTAKKNQKFFTATADIKETGYIRAEIRYKLNPVFEKVQLFGEKTFMGNRGIKIDTKKLPDFFWAFTNPIWIE